MKQPAFMSENILPHIIQIIDLTKKQNCKKIYFTKYDF